MEQSREIIEAREEIDAMMARANGKHTVPQIFIGETHVGGAMDMFELDKTGGLDPLLAPFLKRLAHKPTAAYVVITITASVEYGM